jgi:AraC-like DNA-binding protein
LRYFHRLIETTGTSFTARVNELRLHCAYRHLTDPRASHQRISDIALQSGFSDISHFNRLFVARFGDVSGAIRRGAHGAAAMIRDARTVAPITT